ncbi:hypothetical protein PRZ48_014167 [Zasmidium cellare]|uniref:Uncharacterized protein n=1 Tax=Zasmidium cellare TaxID=395010 RepID=A0ABR0E0P2_ZASCE|nr:hypothetical protein PRZ48_014167 [Zasmidium cellare]
MADRLPLDVTINRKYLRQDVITHQARVVSGGDTPIKTPDYFFEDYYTESEMAEFWGTSSEASAEPAPPKPAPVLALPTDHPTTGGKTVDNNYFEILEAQKAKYQKQKKTPTGAARGKTGFTSDARTPPTAPIKRSIPVLDDDELDGDLPSSPIKRSIPVLDDDELDADFTPSPVKRSVPVLDDDELDGDDLEEQLARAMAEDEPDEVATTPIKTSADASVPVLDDAELEADDLEEQLARALAEEDADEDDDNKTPDYFFEEFYADEDMNEQQDATAEKVEIETGAAKPSPKPDHTFEEAVQAPVKQKAATPTKAESKTSTTAPIPLHALFADDEDDENYTPAKKPTTTAQVKASKKAEPKTTTIAPRPLSALFSDDEDDLKNTSAQQKTFKKPEQKIAKKQDQKTGKKPEQKTPNKPEQKTFNKPEQKIFNKPEQKNFIKPEQKNFIKPEQKNLNKPEQKNFIKPEQKPAKKSEQTPSTKAEQKISKVAEHKISKKAVKKTPKKLELQSGVISAKWASWQSEVDYDWKWHTNADGSKTPQYAHTRRAPRGRDIWVERSKTFFSFPPEVRKMIYSYALFPKGVEGKGPCPMFTQNSTWKVKTPALLRTSFDVRREAIPIYYSEFKVGCSAPMYAKMWLSKIGREARLTLGAITVTWDFEDTKRGNEEQQRLGFYLDFRNFGVGVRKEIIKVTPKPRLI